MFYYYRNQSYIFHTESSLDAINSDRNLNLLNSYLFQESKNLLLNLDEEWGFVTSEVKVNQTSLISPSYKLTIDITTIVNTTQLSFNLEPRVINMFNSINLSVKQLNLDVLWSTQNSSELIKFNITFFEGDDSLKAKGISFIETKQFNLAFINYLTRTILFQIKNWLA